MPPLGSKFDQVVDAVKVIRPGETFRFYMTPKEAKERGTFIAAQVGAVLRSRGVAHKLRRYEHIVVITKLAD